MIKSVGFVGWRGMVGSVLLQRMQEKNDFRNINSHFFSTSQAGKNSSLINHISCQNIKDAYNIDLLQEMDIILTCQGGKYTKEIYFTLRNNGWKGYWIDADSTLRMHDDAIIVLDPINGDFIYSSIEKGIKTFVGSNCTVSLMLMALGGLFSQELIEWISVSTYQSASGAGALHIRELLHQMGRLYDVVSDKIYDNSYSILKMIDDVNESSHNSSFPIKNFLAPLAGSLIPWIDIKMNSGQTREEWKGQVETNKILQSKKSIIIDGTCVRISSLRCHSQSFLIKLKKDISVPEIETIIGNHNKWVSVIPNNLEETLLKLTPSYVTGTLNIPVGRIRKLNMGQKYLSVFTVGDQLLWGAAEPLRRMLNFLLRL